MRLVLIGPALMMAALCSAVQAAESAEKPAAALLDHELRMLNSSTEVNLAERYGGRPLLVVNTASRCGYTGQFEGLEVLHQEYGEAGLAVLGFSSNDFRQEVDDEAEAAEVCYVNYGVTFDMYAPIQVSGEQAHPMFRELARQSEAPRWNFHKYVIDENGQVTEAFPSRVRPDDERLRAAIEAVL